jgi:hypothetical protein
MGKDKIALAICFCLVVALAGFSGWLYLGAKGLESKVSDLESKTSSLETQNAELNEKVQNLTNWRDAFMDASTNFTFMATEQIQITNMEFGTSWIAVTVNNTGTSPVTINEAWINNVKKTTTTPSLPSNIPANGGMLLNITTTVVNGNNYQVKLVSSKGNQFLYTGTAPT